MRDCVGGRGLRSASRFVAVLAFLLSTGLASAQITYTAATEDALRQALTAAASGDTIVFASNITLTGGDLPSVGVSLTIDGAGHTISGANTYRGLYVAGYSVSAVAGFVAEAVAAVSTPAASMLAPWACRCRGTRSRGCSA